MAWEKDLQEGLITKTDRKWYTEAKKLVQKNVGDVATFRQVVTDGSRGFDRVEVTAVGKILDLAAKEAD